MNKSRKNILISSFILIVAVVAAIILSNSWENKIKRSSTEATEKLEKEGITIRTVDTSIFDNQEEDQQTETDSDQETESSQQDKTEKETDKDTNKEEPNKKTEDKPNQGDQPNDQPEPTEQPSLEDIKQTYVSQFTQLETEISGRLDAILDEAITSYATQKDREDFDLRDFQLIYATKVRQLEADSDARFRENFLQLEDDLKENDYAISEAAPYQTQYIEEKQKREKRVIERLTSLQE